MASSSTTKVTMKLLIDTKSQKVLFAEATKPAIDFLFSLLCLPIGTVVRLLTKKGMVGSLGNLYKSVENLGDKYMVPNQNKDVLLKPNAPITSTQIAGFLPASDDSSATDHTLGSSFYLCSDLCDCNVACDKETPCPNCDGTMDLEVNFVGKKVGNFDQETTIKGGFVKDIVTFMVMDDLLVEPMSTISSITLLNKFNIKDVGALQEKVVELGMVEGVNLLKASLQSNMVLTSVFIENNMKKVQNDVVLTKETIKKNMKKTRRRKKEEYEEGIIMTEEMFRFN